MARILQEHSVSATAFLSRPFLAVDTNLRYALHMAVPAIDKNGNKLVSTLPSSASATYPAGLASKRWKQFYHPSSEAGRAVSEHDPAFKDVLVVEDESYLCDLISDVLEAEGHTARKAANGLEALDALRERKPQLILLDLMMPIMDGWEFMETLKRNHAWADIPVIIITAVYDVARTQEETGARAVITKPFDIDQLTEAVRTFAA
jgi:two-component system chemotaxis response regulator CheY